MIKGILFDKDGTLIEFESMWYQIMTSVFEQLVDEDVDKLKALSGYTQSGFQEDSMIQYLSTHEIIHQWMKHIHHHTFQDVFDIFEKAATENHLEVKLLPNTYESLTYLKSKGYILGIATADTLIPTIYNLEKCQIRDFFSFLGTDNGMTVPKPAPDMVYEFAKIAELEPSEILIVGDSISDHEFAMNAEASFIGIDSDYSTLKTLENVEIVDDLMDMIKIKNL